jgi:L-lactate utilization protein LutC
MAWDSLASAEAIQKTITNLGKNGVTAMVVETGAEAKQKVLELLPDKAEVMTMTSVTLDSLGISQEITDSGKYDAVKNKLKAMNRETQSDEMQKLGAAPDWAVGSVHAVTEEGQVVVASNTGSQLPAYAYGANHVIWVVGAQKIVKNLDDAMKRIYDYVLPLESVRAHEAYGVEKSNVSKLFILNKEVNPSRLTLIFVKEKLGF